jgi:predicted nucleotidyltransferase
MEYYGKLRKKIKSFTRQISKIQVLGISKSHIIFHGCRKKEYLNSILLFGSYAKGENDAESDVDILTVSLSKNTPVTELSKLLKRDVNLINFTPAQWSQQAKTNKAFYLDVILDGIVLYGTKPVV